MKVIMFKCLCYKKQKEKNRAFEQESYRNKLVNSTDNLIFSILGVNAF